ncbi:sensor histidine kinase [Actinomadura parmotrematis]|uniref:histidine kinase n=1 Tax=Actinomadura parmotrematis TaxID=2864039 RepID=A0ABS7FS72_9ACTN|nr:HAMP domain-containing sensor histidine kinase [Actinomadura parmotrematis]MBW8482574.1 HAMP domain-containing histidine kinase [Actinomadura parmotrematis]
MRRLSLRGRLALLIAAAVAVAVAACAVLSWFVVRQQLYHELDGRLMASSPGGPGFPPGRGGWRDQQIARALNACTAKPQTSDELPPRSGPAEFIQVVNVQGDACTLPNGGALTVTGADRTVAAGKREGTVHNGHGVTSSGERTDVRIRTVQLVDDVTKQPLGALSVAIDLDEVNAPLEGLALALVAVAALGVVVSAGAGLMIARASLRPVDRLTGAVEHIARTEDLNTRIPEEGTDEIARLSHSFNTMTAALEASRERQQQLIADAGHELRTPLTSLRTNIDLMLRSEATGRELPPETRHRLLTSVKAQMVELSSLVGDLLELARPADREPSRETVALHEVVERAVERARLRGPGLHIDAQIKQWFVHGEPSSLERAVVNLLDNAVKFSPPGGDIEVRLADGELTVRDHGPGIDGADLPHVFERFWRSPSARSLPGSGLGLSIVARVVGEGGGKVALEPAPGGGTLARAWLPGTAEPVD